MPPAYEYYKDIGGEKTRMIKGYHKARKFLCGWCSSLECESRRDMILIPLNKKDNHIINKPISEETKKHLRVLIESLK